MASGMESMLKAFGVDPEQIKKTVEGMAQGVIQVNDRLTRIEATQTEILEFLKNGQRSGRIEQAPNIAPGSERRESGFDNRSL